VIGFFLCTQLHSWKLFPSLPKPWTLNQQQWFGWQRIVNGRCGWRTWMPSSMSAGCG
jgi:hypothetical protein